MKALQTFSEEYLKHCQAMTPNQIMEFLEGFRKLHGVKNPKEKSRLISIKIPENLLRVFRAQCDLKGTPYQTQIKNLMKEWVNPTVK